MDNKLTAAWTGGKVSLAGASALVAKFNWEFEPLWELAGALVVVNVVFGIAATAMQDQWDFVKVAKDLIRNAMLMVLSKVIYVMSARGVIMSTEAGSATGDWFATGVVFLLILQMLHLMQASGVYFGPLKPFLDRLEAKAAAPPDNSNPADGGSVLR